MYQPPHFQETRPDVLHALIRAHPLGLLISNGPDGPVANAIPFLLDPPDPSRADFPPNGRLRAHLAKANPQWKLLADNPASPVLVVFQGADSYVTPSWYETKRETGKVVPTWNYATVQVRGIVRAIEDQDWLARQITDLTAFQEGRRDAPWAVTDAPAPFIQSQIKGIVGLEIDITAIHGKWKVSQNRPVADRAGRRLEPAQPDRLQHPRRAHGLAALRAAAQDQSARGLERRRGLRQGRQGLRRRAVEGRHAVDVLRGPGRSVELAAQPLRLALEPARFLRQGP